MKTKMRGRPGKIVETKTGKKGFWHHGDWHYGKAKVYVINFETFEKTGESLLCDPKTLKVIGCVD